MTLLPTFSPSRVTCHASRPFPPILPFAYFRIKQKIPLSNACKMLSDKLTLPFEFRREIIAYKRYFLKFYEVQPDYIQAKIEWTLKLIQVMPHVPEKYFKHLEGTKGLYEIRVEAGNSTCRIFSFFDKGNVVVLGNAIIKKRQKTPGREIKKIGKIRQEYFHEKEKS
jgi:phage-related protein